MMDKNRMDGNIHDNNSQDFKISEKQFSDQQLFNRQFDRQTTDNKTANESEGARRCIYDSLLETVGHTPLVRIHRMNQGNADVLVKVESFNPSGSVKARTALAMIEDAEKKGLLRSCNSDLNHSAQNNLSVQNNLIVEPTSGNTGIGLAMVAAVKGYRLILTMPETMSIERRKILAAYGAELVLTDGKLGMQGAIDKAEEIVRNHPGAFMPQQFENPSNAQFHRQTTAQEIWNDTDGQVDVFVAGVGTGGTVSGVALGLKEKNPNIYVVAVEPMESAVLSGKPAGTHKIQGIGANFVPKVFDREVIDEILAVSAENAGKTARQAAVKEGHLIGISSGAALFAALELSCQERWQGKTIVALLPDSGERYLSSWLFDDLQ